MGYRNPRYYLLATPNWRDIVSIGRAYKTAITESRNGNEQRSGLRSSPRRSVRWNTDAMSAKESSYLQRFFFKYQNELIGTPIWADGTYLTSEAASGQNELEVDLTSYKEYTVGEEVVIFSKSDWDTYEVGIVIAVTSTLITLRNNLSSTWSEGTEVYPIVRARLNQHLSGTMNTDEYLSAIFELTESLEGSTTTTTTVTGSTTHTTTCSSTSSTTSSTISTTSSTSSTASTTSSTSSTASTTSTFSTTSSTSSTASTSSTVTSTTHSTTTSSTASSSTTYTEYPGTDSYTTDWREYTVNNFPSDWTGRWYYATGGDADVVAYLAGSTGGKVLEFDCTNESYMSAISWDDVGTPSSVEVLAKVMPRYEDPLNCSIVLRGGGSIGVDDEGIELRIIPVFGTDKIQVVVRGVSGDDYDAGDDSGPFNFLGNWYWARFIAIGNDIKAKVWKYGTSEPSDWQIEITEPGAPHTGWVGLATQDTNQNFRCDYFGVMLDRSDMPLPIYTTTTTTTTSTTTTTTTA